MTGATGSPTSRCPVCRSRQPDPFLVIPSVPVHVGVLWTDGEQARRCARGQIALTACPGCGLVRNTAFDEGLIDYSQKYDNSLHGSPLFQTFERELVDRLTDRHGVAGARVAEVGCGDGHFLGLLCQAGAREGIGIDPAHDPAHADRSADDRVQFVREPLSGQDLSDVALVACRQTLEHVTDPVAFLEELREALRGTEAVLYVDVPDSALPFHRLSIWDLIYEHPLYFVAPSLRTTFERSGFEVLDLRTTFQRQFLSVEASPGVGSTGLPAPDELASLHDDLNAFADRFRHRSKSWRDRLAAWASSGRDVVVWGGGARAVTFFNLLEVSDEIRRIVDVNPRKQGTYLAGTGHPILAPTALADDPPDAVVVLNPEYVPEITASLHALGLDPEIVIA